MLYLSGHFRLDPRSGQLRTAVNLNYEEVSEYVLLVEANENLPSVTQVQYASKFMLWRTFQLKSGAKNMSSVFATQYRLSLRPPEE